MWDDLIGDRRLMVLISGLSPHSAWWSSVRDKATRKPPLEGAAAVAYFDSIAGG